MQAAALVFTIVAALVLMSWRGSPHASGGWRLLLPISGAMLRGLGKKVGKADDALNYFEQAGANSDFSISLDTPDTSDMKEIKRLR